MDQQQSTTVILGSDIKSLNSDLEENVEKYSEDIQGLQFKISKQYEEIKKLFNSRETLSSPNDRRSFKVLSASSIL